MREAEAGKVKSEVRAVEPDGKEQLLDYLMRRFSASVVKIAYYHLRDRHLAEDIMQEVFCRVFKNMDSFRRESSYYTWIYRITVNLCSDYKKSAYNRRISLKDTLDGPYESEARLFEEAEGGEVFSCVMDLPLKYRTVMALHYFEDMPTPEVARMLKISESAVRTRLHRGRNLLKDVLRQLDL